MAEEVTKSNKPKGFGKLHFVKKAGVNPQDELGYFKSHAASCQYTYPMKLILPMHASSTNCQWVYPVNYGGGLVAGDTVDLAITIEGECCVLLTSQSSTKVYSSENGHISEQTFKAVVKDRSFFACIQDPVTCYATACYKQTQDFYLSGDSSLILMDWLTAGRIARGERWDFKLLHTTNSIYVDDVLYYRDSIRLTDNPNLPLFENMSKYNIVASCILIGKDLKTISSNIHNELSQCRRHGSPNDIDTVVAVSKLIEPPKAAQHRIPGIVIRMASTSISKVYAEMNRLLKPVFGTLGGNPFEGKF